MTQTAPRLVAITSDVLYAADAITESIEKWGGSFDTRFSDDISTIHPSEVSVNGSRTWLVGWLMQSVLDVNFPIASSGLHL
jgi:hypothetical protein